MKITNQIWSYLQTFLEGLQGFGEWFFTPIEWLEPIFKQWATPATILTLGGLTTILVLHVIHLANVISG